MGPAAAGKEREAEREWKIGRKEEGKEGDREKGEEREKEKSLTRIHALPLSVLRSTRTVRTHTNAHTHARTRAAGRCVRTRNLVNSDRSLPQNANFVARPGGANFQHPRLHSPAGLGALFLLGHPLTTPVVSNPREFLCPVPPPPPPEDAYCASS